MTLTFWPKNHRTYRISQGHYLYQIWRLWDHSFLSYAADSHAYTDADKCLLPWLDSQKKNPQCFLFIIQQQSHSTHNTVNDCFYWQHLTRVSEWSLTSQMTHNRSFGGSVLSSQLQGNSSDKQITWTQHFVSITLNIVRECVEFNVPLDT